MRPGTQDFSKAYRRVLATNSTMLTISESSGVVAVPTTVTHPSLIDLAKGSSDQENFTVPRFVEFLYFGAGANNDNLDILHTALHPALVDDSTTMEWIPVNLAFVNAVKSAVTGTSAGGALTTGDFVCDTITVASGTTDQPGNKNSPAADRVGWHQVDVRGHRYIVSVFASTANGKDGNALYRVLQ